MPNKQNSNETELSFAEETSIGVLPATPVWTKLDPNSYNDFGGETVLVSRSPITKDRQMRQGTVVDVDAAGGFNLDLTYSNVWKLMQGFFFKDVAEKPTTKPMNTAQVAITGVTTAGDEYTASSGLSVFNVGHLIYAENFTNLGNNGLTRVSGVTAGTDVAVDANLVNETPPASAFFQAVGFQFDINTVDVDVSGSLPILSRDTGTQDWTSSGLVIGDMIYLGGDAASTKFTNSANNGFGRISAITTSSIEFDKFSGTMVTETGAATSKTIQIFFGDRVNNDTDGNNIDRRTYNIERTLGNDGSGTQSEYLVGAVPNELTINITESDKIAIDMGFLAINHENRNGTTGVKSGTRPSFVEGVAFNTTSDVSRIKMAVMSATDENPSALFAYLSDLTLTINNNLSPNKGISVMGAFDMAEGHFAVSGDLNAYFGDIAASNAVKNNSDVSLDFAIVKQNRGFAIDVPLVSLADGRNEVVAQESIKVPLSQNAAKHSTLDYTLSMTRFAYLPTAAG